MIAGPRSSRFDTVPPSGLIAGDAAPAPPVTVERALAAAGQMHTLYPLGRPCGAARAARNLAASSRTILARRTGRYRTHLQAVRVKPGPRDPWGETLPSVFSGVEH